MEMDDELCLCFHITRRKVVNFIRIEKPQRVAQLSECGGAGTGCGWCRPFLKQLFEQGTADLPESTSYAQQRAAYIDASDEASPPS